MLSLLMLTQSQALFSPLQENEWSDSGECSSYVCQSATTSTSLLSTCLIYSNQTSKAGNISVYSGIGCKNKDLRYNFCNTDQLDISDPSTYDVKCSYPSLNYSTLYPGESPCWSDENCVSGTCIDYTCVGKPLGSECQFSYECQPGLACKANDFNVTVCDDLIRPFRAKCYTDNDCVNSAGCDYDANNDFGMCVPYFSIKVGSQVLQCDNFTSLLCEKVQCRLVKEVYKCVEPSVSKSLPLPCTVQKDCTDKKEQFYSECLCGMNAKRQKFCRPFPGDSVSVELLKSLKKWVSSKSILACSNERRWDFNCMRKWEPKLYDKLKYDVLHYYNYSVIQGNEDCIKEIFTYMYWDAKENMEITSFALGLAFNVLFLALG